MTLLLQRRGQEIVTSKFVSGYCSHAVMLADMYRFVAPLLVTFDAHLASPGFGISTSVHLCCLAVVSILSNASSRGMVMWKQRVREGWGGFQPPSRDSSVPRSSRPSQVAEAMGSFRSWFLFLASAEHPDANSVVHRIRAIVIVVMGCRMVVFRRVRVSGLVGSEAWGELVRECGARPRGRAPHSAGMGSAAGLGKAGVHR